MFITLKGKAITTGLAYEAGFTWIVGASVSSWANNFPSTGRKTIVDYDVCNSVDKGKLVGLRSLWARAASLPKTFEFLASFNWPKRDI